MRGRKQLLSRTGLECPPMQLASAGFEGCVRVWDVETGAEVRTLDGLAGSVSRVAFSPDGRRLAAAAWHDVKVWDAATGAVVSILRGHRGVVWSLAFSPDGRRLASTSGYSGNGEIIVWDAPQWDQVAEAIPNGSRSGVARA